MSLRDHIGASPIIRPFVPGMLPPVKFELTVDGKRVTELHADGGATADIVAEDESDRGGIDLLNTVLNRTSDFGADLVVMGARGKHGVPFPRAGRITRKSLESMIAPVLLSM